MRVGIIGGGFGLNVQAPIIKMHPMLNLVAVSTMFRHELPLELIGEDNSPTHYRNWTEMLNNEELDLLFISSMPIYHFQMVEYALKNGIKNIVCEKPFTLNSNESRQLLNLSEQYKAKVIIDFEWRYLPIRQKAKELITNNNVGKLLHIDYNISHAQYQVLQTSKRGWMGEKQKFGGMLGALGTHMIDCLRWLAQDEIVSINGLVHTHVPIGAGEQRDADDAFFINGKMKKNSTFSVQLLTGINHGFGSHLKVFGDEGTVSLINDKQIFYGKAKEQLEEIVVPNPSEAPLHFSLEAKAYYPSFYPFIEKVYEYIVYNKPDKDLPLIEDGHENQVVIKKILEI
ncbi:hypothetical protein NCCP2222_18920 [Sporosarcina sp. NCCP-2222]|uniref:Gfo/Idh/MocA family protein n=1 Tax=Sporosarcina sp. NCCP-2222 TaxID=2935073 RepID=UPI0020849E23|nr:Gfo/Idh/MocA family oxidoreductase [Sporosarcina sp. NCCP-2222]GKV55945.1 hypothetical protein NCCP2222_18920 [Sporosarcina sp. NCCP-2222]